MDSIEAKLDKMLNNHLTHIERDQKTIREFVGWGVGALLIIQIFIIIAVLS